MGDTNMEDRGKDMIGFRACIFFVLLVHLPNKCAGLEMYDIRLVNGGDQFQGRLEVHALSGVGLGFERWWSVCQDEFDWQAADVACRQLGYEHGADEIHKDDYFQPSTNNWQIRVDFICSGSEYSLEDCDYESYNWWECSHTHDVGLTCNACGDPGMPVNAERQIESFTLGSQVEYTCTEGTLVGDQVLVCQEDGTWSGTLPMCIVESPATMCGSPAEIPHGSISFSAEGLVLIGTSITYSCLPGYNLIGMATRTCLENATWSGVEPECQIVECTDPGLPEGTVREPVESFHYNVALVYNCSDGYVLHENTSESVLVLMCLENGTWSKPLPICLKVTGSEKDETSASLNNSFGVIVAVIMGALLFIIAIVVAVVIYKRRLLPKFCALFSKEQATQPQFNNILYEQRENLYAEPCEVRAFHLPTDGGESGSAPANYNNHLYNQVEPVYRNEGRTDSYEDLRPRQISPYTQLDQSTIGRLDSAGPGDSPGPGASTYDDVGSPGYQDPSQWQSPAENIYSDLDSLGGYQDPGYALPTSPPPGGGEYEEVPDILRAPPGGTQ